MYLIQIDLLFPLLRKEGVECSVVTVVVVVASGVFMSKMIL